MEESMILSQIKQVFDCGKQDIRTYSPLTLAYIGDGVYELIIRTVVVERANRNVNDLNRIAVRYVKASAQAEIIEALQPFLTEEEAEIYKRGRNAKPHSAAKNASLSDYHKATGFEALIGYLYLADRTDRVLELVKKGVEAAGMSI